VKVWTTF